MLTGSGRVYSQKSWLFKEQKSQQLPVTEPVTGIVAGIVATIRASRHLRLFGAKSLGPNDGYSC